MSDLKTPKNIIKIGGKEFNIILTTSVIDELQNKYDDLTSVLEKLDDFKTMTKELAEITAIFINDDIECHNEDYPDKWETVTADWVCRRIALNDNQTDNKKILAVDLALAIMRAFNISMPEVDDPNMTTPTATE